MVKIYVNNILTYVPNNSSVLEACRSIGVDVPRFCFHERLSVAGNCRMCLVELEKSPKPVASCAMPVVNNMRVYTDTPLVKKARESVIEFLLVNHPLDCPICDQAGECDLQDQTMAFGSDKNRFFSFKRSVEDKYCGPLVKTIMNRCIHCTRCVRFMVDIAGLEDLGTTNRGRSTEIGTYLRKALKSELSANVVDLCPVGALTSKPYAFIARPWELRSVESIDLTDSIGSNIRVDFKETELVRVLPKKNEKLNEEWISDKTRYSFDALKTQRVDKPYIRNSSGVLEEYSWDLGLNELTNLVSGTASASTSLVVSPNLGVSALTELKSLAESLGVQNFGFPRQFSFDVDFNDSFSLNTLLDEIKLSDFCLFIGANPRYEAAMLNLKVRKRALQESFDCFSLGVAHDLTYGTKVLGISPETLLEIAEGKHFLCKALKNSKKPLLVYSASIAERKDFPGLENIIKSLGAHSKVLTAHSNGFCFLNQESNQVGAFSLGIPFFKSSKLKSQKLCVFFGCFNEDDLTFLNSFYNSELKVVSITSNGSSLIGNSSLILPLVGAFEYEDSFVNAEGVTQKAQKAASMSPLGKDITEILYLLKKGLTSNGVLTPTKSTEKFKPFFFSKSELMFSSFCGKKKRILASSNISKTPFYPFITDFYTTGFLSEFSTTMAKCSQFYRLSFNNFISSF